MNINVSESIWLDEQGVCSAEQLIEISGLSDDELDDLIENDVIAPINDATHPPAFQMRCIVTANIARRLRDDFELDRHGLILALTLMRRIDQLQEDLDAMRAHLDHKLAARK